MRKNYIFLTLLLVLVAVCSVTTVDAKKRKKKGKSKMTMMATPKQQKKSPQASKSSKSSKDSAARAAFLKEAEAKVDAARAAAAKAKEEAQEDIAYTDFASQVVARFTDYYKLGIDEKLYLQTDKPYYSGGEKIWFKGYLVNAITHTPLNFSNFIYVELSHRKGDMVSRVKVRRDSTGFNGYINLDPKVKAGEYTLSAYTRWMTNKDDWFFHKKDITIVSPIPESFASLGEAEQEEMTERQKRKEEEEAQKKAEEEAKLAEKKLDYELQFFPEGGSLLPKTSQIVAFKALAEDGLSIGVKGEIFNAKDEPMGELETTHKGMGIINMNAKAGEQYYAVVKSSEGVEKRFNLPVAVEDGVTLKVSQMGDRVYYQVLTTQKALVEGAHIVIHSRGRIVTTAAVNPERVSYISNAQLYDGVSIFSLVDSANNVMAERLIFKRPALIPMVDIKSAANNYAKRESARYSVKVLDSTGAPAKGEFAVSVTDNSSIEIDPNQENMMSYLLLSSEIKGYVEEPGYYFSENTPQMGSRLDLLMLTQGWRRFDLANMLRGENKLPSKSYEESASISGEVKGFFGNAARKPNLYVLCSKLNYIDTFSLEESNKFELVDLNIPDSTTYIVQSRGRNGGNTMTLKIYPDTYPKVKSTPLAKRAEIEEVVPMAFLNQSQDKFYYEGGMQMISLESISVTTARVVDTGVDAGFSTDTVTREDLEAMGGMQLSDYLLTFSGITIESGADVGEGDEAVQSSDEYVFYRGDATPVKFMVNGVDDEYSNLRMITTDEIEQIDFYSGADAAAFSDASGGVFNITLREGSSVGGVTLPNIAHVDQLGYQCHAEFYQPSYEKPSVKANWPPDFRTTIYWNGALKSDENGEFNFDFFTADKATTYTVTIEGLTEKGEVCRASATLERTLAN